MRLSKLLSSFFTLCRKRKTKSQFRRRKRAQFRRIEMLEARHMLAAAIWHNVLQPLNVSGETDGGIDPLDALIVINEINNPRYSNRGVLPPVVDDGDKNPFLDVDCDSYVSPLDVLSIINAINSGVHEPSWNFESTPPSNSVSGRVTASGCSPMLIEGNSLETQLSKTVELPDESSAIRVTFETPNFDTQGQASIRDAFEIVVTDENNQPLVLPFKSRRDASYNWSEGLAFVAGPGVQVGAVPNSSFVTSTVNLAGLAAHTKVKLKVRLINNDSDTNSSVVIRQVEVIDSSTPRPTGMASEEAARPLNVNIATEQLQDVSYSVTPIYGNTTLVKASEELITEIQLANSGTNGIPGNLVLTIGGLSDLEIGVQNPDGYLPGGQPYFLMASSSANGWLNPGEKTAKRELRFKNVRDQQFQFQLTSLALWNQPPSGFTSTPLLDVLAGKLYETTVTAKDPDGQSLLYSLVAAPESMSIDRNTGRIRWQTQLSDVGNQSMVVRATDPFGLSVEQSFTIRVLSDVPNRPPVITSNPPTNAEVAGTFEVTTWKTGNAPIGVTSIHKNGSLAWVTSNSGDNTLSLINSSGTLNSLSIGEPPPDQRFFQSGTNIDIGLPKFVVSSDAQKMDAIEQADLNGDGALDFVLTSITIDSRAAGSPRDRSLSVLLSNGDGTFQTPVKLPIRTVFNDSDEDRRPVTSVLLQDFDGDGRVDILAVSYSETSATQQNQILFWHGNGDGTFAPLSIRDPGAYIGRIRPADLNNDGKLDLIATKATWDSMGVFMGNGDGTFGPYVEFSNSPNAGYYHTEGIADLDGKNGLDVVVSSYTRREYDIFLNDGQGNLSLATSIPGTNEDPLGLITGDFTGDGIQDFVTLHRVGVNGGGLEIMKGSGDGKTFSMAVAGEGHAFAPVNVNSTTAARDLNNDGKLDLVFSHHEGNSGITVALNRGNGTFDLQNYQNVSPPAVAGNIGIQELSVFVGDYNRDGLFDLAVPTTYRNGSQAYAGLTLMLATSAGHYGSPIDQNYADTGGNSAVAGINYAADFNNDGNIDLFAVAFQNSQRIRFGNGDGTFQSAVVAGPYLGNEFYGSGFHADFNGDGNEDVLWYGGGGVQGGPSARIIVGFNNGAGAFDLQVYHNPDGDYYYVGALAVGDFNGDGKQDFAGRGNGYIDVWLYDALQGNKFTRSTRIPLPAGETTYVLSASDVDNDGDDDLIATTGRNGESQNYSLLHTYLSNGDGTFPSVRSQPLFNINSDAVYSRWSATGDINNDGKIDLVLNSQYSRTSVLLGNGDGSFQTATDYFTGNYFASTRNVYLRDLDADGNLDMISVDDGPSRNLLRVRPGFGDGTFGIEEVYAAAGGVTLVDFADVNNDGRLDAIVGTGANNYNFSTVFFGSSPGVGDVVSNDVNNDGLSDLITLNYANHRVKIQTQNADQTFRRLPDLVVDHGPIAVAALDFNNDSRIDILTANRIGKSVTVLRNSGSTVFTRQDIKVGSQLSAMTTGDLTGDGKPDVVVASEVDQGIFLLKNNGTSFDAPIAIGLGDVPGELAVADATGDGRNDIVIVLPKTNRIVILPGKGDGTFSAPIYTQLAFSPGAIAASDLNQDGRVDLAITIPSADNVALLFGRGEGRFAKPQTIRVGDEPIALKIEDFNGDQLPDLIVANRGDNTVSVIENHYDPSKLYRYSIAAYDPDGDPLTYELDGPGGMLLDSSSGQMVWAPTADQIGLQSVHITVSDGRGGATSQNFDIAVQPIRNNAAPVIYETPRSFISADEAFVYQPQASDPDQDRLRYRLLSGPDGATIDPTTGTVQWDPRTTGMQINSGNYSSATITIPMRPALQPSSVTVEGFFRMETLTNSQTFFRKASYAPYPFTVSTFELSYYYGQLTGRIGGTDSQGGLDTNSIGKPWQPALHHWYHLALTFDDATGLLSVYLDGQLFMQGTFGRHLIYDGLPILVGQGYNSSLIGAVNQFRIWNYAKSEQEIQQMLGVQATDDAPGLVLDYRFQDGDSITVHDSSQAGSHGSRAYDNAWPFPIVGLANKQTQYFTIAVEDGRGGVTTQSFRVEVVQPFSNAISGTLYKDDDRNGSQNGTEAGIFHSIVYIDANDNDFRDPEEAFSWTDATGHFEFPNQLAGLHKVRVEPIAGYEAKDAQFVRLDSYNNSNISFGLIPKAGPSIQGTVYIDNNGNGLGNEIQAVYQSDFQAVTPDLSAWSSQDIVTSPNGTRVLGKFGFNDVTLTLNDLKPHDSLQLSLDLAIIDSWDGNGTSFGPDIISILDEDGNEIFRSTFSNGGERQSYPDSFPGGDNPARTGAIAVNSLGWNESLYRLSFSMLHSKSIAKFTFRGINLQSVGDESWALKSVTATSTEPVAAGWTAYLDENGNKLRDATERYEVTDAFGHFAFSNLYANDWHVRLETPSAWSIANPVEKQFEVRLLANGNSSDNNFVVQATGVASASTTPKFIATPRAYATVQAPYRYDHSAIDPGFRKLTYSLLSGPKGMSIEPESGVIVWTPTLNQIGSQRVLIQVRNDQGGSAVQDFTIEVSPPNSNPVVTSSAPASASVDKQYRYDVVVQDAEQSQFKYRLLGQPNGATIDVQTGQILWTPNNTQIGVREFVVEVSDEHGGFALHRFSVDVAANPANQPPVLGSNLRRQIAAGSAFHAVIQAQDADGDALNYSLVNGPIGLTITPDGNASWKPTLAEIGIHSFTVRVEDGRGGLDTQQFAIEVTNQVQNHAPQIVSQPPTMAIVDALYSYDVNTHDSDFDAVIFELVSGPVGMSLNPWRGTLRWKPTSEQLGKANVVLRAMDLYGGTSEQSFEINVTQVGGPPIIQSVPWTTAAVGKTYLYSVSAFDAGQSPIRYNLLNAPSGMSINPVSGELAWTPVASDVGSKQIVLQASNSLGSYSTQSFTIEVRTGEPNQAPTILSHPTSSATVSQPFEYKIEAVDPAGSSLTYVKRRGPSNLIVDPTTGQVTWTPTSSDVGSVSIVIAAIDAQGAAAVQSFIVDVIPENSIPIISSIAPTFATARGAYRYDVRATDANLDPLVYELIDAPANMSIDSFGRLRWNPSISDLGNHTFKLRVSDPRGGVAEQNIALRVVPDTTPPRVVVLPSSPAVRANSPEVFAQFNITPIYPSNTVRINAIDDVGVTQLTVTANGKPVALDEYGNATFRFEDWGFGSITIIAKALDAAGNESTAVKAIAFLPYGDDPAIANFANPLAAITSPVNSEAVTGFVNILGSASSDNFVSYTLSYRRADSSVYQTIASRNTKVTQGVLGVWDTTLLENDEYVLRLEVQDDIFGTTAYEQNVGVSGSFKLGNFRLGFSDLTIPVHGIPITVSRIYDSLRSQKDGELGFGWQLDYRDVDLRTGLAKTGLEDLGIYSSFKPGTRVYLTLPGGQREGFTFTPDIRVLPGFGGALAVATPKFMPDRGVLSQLSVQGGSFLVNEMGELVSGGGQPYNPAAMEFGGGYTLTTPDGIQYRIDGATGKLTSATDRNGIKLTFSDQEVASEDGLKVRFERDAQGRITTIIGPSSKQFHYRYDSRGDLVEFTDRAGNSVRYEYLSQPAHYLNKVIDPLGNAGIRMIYGPDGRIIETVDAKGNRQTTNYDPDNDLVTTTDALGNKTTFEYDARGNVVSITDALGGISQMFYDESDNLISTVDALGRSTQFSYDASGNVLSSSNALGEVTRWTYDRFGNTTSTTDAMGRTSQTEYDSSGNSIRSITPSGAIFDFARNDSGQLQSAIAPGGFSIDLSYQSGSQPTLTSDWNGLVANMEYSITGEPISKTYTVPTVNGPQAVTERMAYDANGRLLSRTDAAGNAVSFEYDASGRAIATVDALGNKTSFEYDSLGNLVKTIRPDGLFSIATYDALGHVLSETDASGETTYYEYDALGRRTTVIEPDNTPETLADNPRRKTVYDAVGQVMAEINELGFKTQFEYDAAGRLTTVIDALGNTTRTFYDAAGNVLKVIDPLGRQTHIVYDTAGRQIGMTFADGSAVSSVLDERGIPIRKIDEVGHVTGYEYTSGGSVSKVIDALGNQTRYEYDVRGKLIRQIDANGHITRFEYDILGRKVARILPNGQRSVTEYDANSRVSKTIDSDNNTVVWQYNALDQVVSRERSDGVTFTYTYFADGQVETITSPQGVTRFEYDVRDRLTKRTEPDGQSIAYAYDDVGHVLSMTTSGGTVLYVYNAIGQLTSVRDPLGGLTQYQFDAAGQLTQTDLSNGVVERREYDDRGRLTHQYSQKGTTTIVDQQYTYDQTGRAIAINDTGLLSEYEYDAIGRLVLEKRENAPGVRYGYDAVGNRLSRTEGSSVTTYEFDANDRLLKSQQGSRTTLYSYDESGRLLSQKTGTDQLNYSWDADGNLVRVDSLGTQSAHEEYRYDVFGNRVATIHASGETRYLLDLNGNLSQIALSYLPSGVVLATQVYGNGLIGEISNGSATNFVSDRLGSVRAKLDGVGTIITDLRYDAFGNLISASGANDHEQEFLGSSRSLISGLTDLRARQYDSATGRFISTDPFIGYASLPMSRHRYLYSNQDPINFSDPSGEFAISSLAESAFVQGLMNTLRATFTVKQIKKLKDKAEIAVAGFNTAYMLAYFAANTALYASSSLYSNSIDAEHFAARGKLFEAEVGKNSPSWVRKVSGELISKGSAPYVKLALQFAEGKTDNNELLKGKIELNFEIAGTSRGLSLKSIYLEGSVSANLLRFLNPFSSSGDPVLLSVSLDIKTGLSTKKGIYLKTLVAFEVYPGFKYELDLVPGILSG